MNSLLSAIGSAARSKRGVRGDSCGCAMGAKFLGIGLIFSIAWYGWHWHSAALSVGSVCWRVALAACTAAAVGKTIGILVFRLGTFTHSRIQVASPPHGADVIK